MGGAVEVNSSYEIEAIHNDLLLTLGSLNRETFRQMKRFVGIQPFQTTCSHEQWVKLWAYAAIRRQYPTKRITLVMVLEFLARKGKDPRTFFPGLISSDPVCQPKSDCLGCDLRQRIYDDYRLEIPESTLARYCQKVLGRGLHQFERYSAAEIRLLVDHRARLRAEKLQRSVAAGNKLAEHNRQKRERERLNMRSA